MKWYILQVHTGFEKKVKASIEERSKQDNLQTQIGKVVVPTENTVEIVKGVKKTSSRNVYPGYVLIQMDFNDETWHLIQETPKVSGFIGGQDNPTPLSDADANKIISQMEESSLRPVPKYHFEKGEQVIVTEGPFANFHGLVDEVKPDKGKVSVLVSIFGRSTPVELEFSHVQKVS
jgi:transcriptional antiterminator NusG